MRQHETYLGDGVYVHFDSERSQVVLTTGHHDPGMADNVIYLEAEVIGAFMNWMLHTAKVVRPVDKDGKTLSFEEPNG